MKNNKAAVIGQLLEDQEYNRAAALADQWSREMPTDPMPKYLFGVALIGLRRYGDAVGQLRQCLVLNPKWWEAHNNIGIAFKELGDEELAETHYKLALTCKPNCAEAFGNLGVLNMERGNTDSALAYFESALSLDKTSDLFRLNLGIAYSTLGEYVRSAAYLESVIGDSPLLADAHANLAHVLLTFGEYESAWPEYEWRTERRGDSKLPPAAPTLQSISGKKVLVTMEQGYGDHIQMARYVPMLEKIASSVRYEIPAALSPIYGEEWPRLNLPFIPDVRIPNMSLPLLFETTISTIPEITRQLSVPWDSATKLSDAVMGGLDVDCIVKVGVVWAGSTTHRNDRNRSCKLDDLSPLSKLPGVQLFSLQKGTPAGQLESAGFPIVDLGVHIDHFGDTAAAIDAMDLVVSVDTSVAHLAGSMGAATWTLLPKAPDWRWMLDRDDSLWYPSMRLFRQAKAGDWAEVLSRVAEEVRFLINRKKSGFSGDMQRAAKLLDERNLVAATELAHKCVSSLPKDVCVCNDLGALFWNASCPEVALEMFMKALEINPQDRTTVLNCHDVLVSYQMFDEARSLVNNYLANHPNDATVFAMYEQFRSAA